MRRRPEIVIYEPLRTDGCGSSAPTIWSSPTSGTLQHPGSPPQLMGQLFHLFESPNRFGLPAFYTLHVWAWKENPTGTFVNWHQGISCDGFDGDLQ